MKTVNFSNLKWLWCSLLLMLLDIGSKYWIKTRFSVGEVLCISSYCNFYYIYNSGLAFGLFSGINLIYRWFLVWVIALVIVIFIIALCESIKYCSKYYYFAYSMIIGGSSGNLFDRILYNAVIDFIDIHLHNWHWPVFNIADIEICTGIIILIIRHHYIFLKRRLLHKIIK